MRLASLIFTAPVLLLCILAMVFNWPADCPERGCGDPGAAGSAVAIAFYGVALAAYVTGATAVVLDRLRIGWGLLALATALVAWGILF